MTSLAQVLVGAQVILPPWHCCSIFREEEGEKGKWGKEGRSLLYSHQSRIYVFSLECMVSGTQTHSSTMAAENEISCTTSMFRRCVFKAESSKP